MSGWRLDGDKDAMNLDVIGPKGRIAMMDCENFEVSDDELGANATLIAAAPDLLAALELAWPLVVKAQTKGTYEACKAISAAINKATGADQ